MVHMYEGAHIVSIVQAKMADFDVKSDEVLGEGVLLYGDFMMPNTDNKIYEEITDQEKVHFATNVLVN